MTGTFEAFAEQLRWVAWRNEERDGKLTKVPYGRHGRRAKANDATTWISRAEAAWRVPGLVNGHGGGIGIQLGELGNERWLVGVDLDTCIDADQCLAPWAEKILGELPTYAEVSPSGTGMKAFFVIAAAHVRPFLDLIGAAPEGWGIKRGIDGSDRRDHAPGVEIYLSHRFFAVTGQIYPGGPAEIRHLDEGQLRRLAAVLPQKQPGTDAFRGRDTSRSRDAFILGKDMRREGKSYEEFVAAALADPRTAEWTRTKGQARDERELHRIWEKVDPEVAPSSSSDDFAPPLAVGARLDDFYAYLPGYKFIYMPTRELWPADSINARFPPIGGGAGRKPIKPAAFLAQTRPIEQMTWVPEQPDKPPIIRDKLVSEGGWIAHPGATVFNLYLPGPRYDGGNPKEVEPWLDHIRKIYPDDVNHIVRWFAHRVQRPWEKLNHALVLGGPTRIGKDTMIEPVKQAVGAWNFKEAAPSQVMGKNNDFVKAVILRINETRDLGDYNRYAFYDHMKPIIAAPPDVLRVNTKYVAEYSVFNVVAVIETTNHKAGGMHIPSDDRRHYVAWSEATCEDFDDAYWQKLWGWYDAEGIANVAAYLAQPSTLGDFNPKASPPRTAAFWDFVNTDVPDEEAELRDVLEKIKQPPGATPMPLTKEALALYTGPDIVTLRRIIDECGRGGGIYFGNTVGIADWLSDRRNSRLIPHRMEACGYVPARNPDATDGLWRVNEKRQVVYGKATLERKELVVLIKKIIKDETPF